MTRDEKIAGVRADWLLPGWVELHVSGEDLPRVLAKFERHGDRHKIVRLVIDGEVNSSTLRAIPIGRLESLLNIKDEPGNTRREPLTRPAGIDPKAFSRRVAEAYNEAVQKTPKPATVLAAEAGVPVTTVHRWIREARQRGFLPPARQGRAG